jgi:hypothetical protein
MGTESQYPVVENLPTDGRTIYVRCSRSSRTTWQYRDYALTTSAIVTTRKAELVSPASGSTLTSSAVTLQWTGGLSVSQYWLWVGTATGASNLLNRDMGTALSALVTDCPPTGARSTSGCDSMINGAWGFQRLHPDRRHTGDNAKGAIDRAGAGIGR